MSEERNLGVVGEVVVRSADSGDESKRLLGYGNKLLGLWGSPWGLTLYDPCANSGHTGERLEVAKCVTKRETFEWLRSPEKKDTEIQLIHRCE